MEKDRKKKKSRKIPTESENYEENHVDEKVLNTEERSKKKHTIKEQEVDVHISDDHENSLSKKSKKKKKRKHFDLENTESSDEPKHKKVKENTSDDGKKSKKESKLDLVHSDYSDSTNCKKHKKKKHKEHAEEDNHLASGNSDDEIVAKKKKKDKKKKNKDKPFECNHEETEITDDAYVSNDKKSKKKKKIEIEENKYDKKMKEESSNCQDSEEVTRKSKKKKKKNKDNSNSDSDSNQNSIKADLNKKAKKKLKHKDNELSDHIRQKDENGRKNDTKVETHQTGVTGQWGTAFNENKDKQSKFLRLLGGFKKGGEEQDTKTQKFTSKFANHAMDKSSEENYQKKLEHQYEKAITSNFQRGIGLGFQPPPEAGKKFYIDKGSSKSIKFDN